MKTQKIPKWFEGQIYEKGDLVTNPFSGQTYELNGLELSMYDFIMGTQFVMEKMPKSVTKQMVDDFYKGLDWFKDNNIDAYFALLD
jgi:hypothetical protein|tara:strand:+ start:127 stop:384 length:258 start_codon:yes stop_codon:yes gene_type:complete